MRLNIWTDGGARGNPGPAGAGVVISDEYGVTLLAKGFYMGESTNNMAEYEGLVRGLLEAKKLGGTSLKIYCDSELIVRQVTGVYKVKKEHLRKYYLEVIDLMGGFEKVEINHVMREDNVSADAMVNAALDGRRDVNGDIEGAYEEAPEAPAVVVVDIEDLVQFREGGIYRERIFSGDSVLGELVCVAAGQRGEVKLMGTAVTLTVMRGRGTVEAGEEKVDVKAGVCMYLEKVEALGLAADEGMVMIITGIRD